MMMTNKRPAINYTMAWLCTFQIGRETEAVVFMTDDFDTILKEYEKMKSEHPGVPVIFTDHKLIGKGRLLISDDMIAVPFEVPNPADDQGEKELQGIVNALGVGARRGDGQVIEPVINADEANAHPRRIQRLANDGRLDNADTPWMRGHNKDIAARMLKEPDPSKI